MGCRSGFWTKVLGLFAKAFCSKMRLWAVFLNAFFCLCFVMWFFANWWRCVLLATFMRKGGFGKGLFVNLRQRFSLSFVKNSLFSVIFSLRLWFEAWRRFGIFRRLGGGFVQKGVQFVVFWTLVRRRFVQKCGFEQCFWTNRSVAVGKVSWKARQGCVGCLPKASSRFATEAIAKVRSSPTPCEARGDAQNTPSFTPCF